MPIGSPRPLRPPAPKCPNELLLNRASTSPLLRSGSDVGNVPSLKLPNQTVDLPTGHLLVLDQNVPHDVEAEEDSAFLLTLSWPSKESAKRETNQQK
jgi:hypothetical protein